MSRFRLEDILNVTFANTQEMKQKKMYETYRELQRSMIEANAADDTEKELK